VVNTANYLESTHATPFTGSRTENKVPFVLGSSDCSRRTHGADSAAIAASWGSSHINRSHIHFFFRLE
jgi:hypothetical protein